MSAKKKSVGGWTFKVKIHISQSDNQKIFWFYAWVRYACTLLFSKTILIYSLLKVLPSKKNQQTYKWKLSLLFRKCKLITGGITHSWINDNILMTDITGVRVIAILGCGRLWYFLWKYFNYWKLTHVKELNGYTFTGAVCWLDRLHSIHCEDFNH